MTRIRLRVNGGAVEGDVEPRTHLADFVRETLLLTGTHLGCEQGVCGACTVEIDGEIARSCITYAVACDGAEVRTIEGFGDDPLMSDLRRAFTEEHALQCGYCTPGMLIAARDLIRRRASLSREEIRVEMSGNLCRCTGYIGIVNAIARVMAERGEAEAARPQGSWLGPAPGPVVLQKETRSQPELAIPIRSQPATPKPGAVRQRIKVTVGAPREVGGGTTEIDQSFHLDHPRDVVWRLMSDPEAVAACIPGMSIEGPPEGGRVRGRMLVRLGPVAASFAGEATIQRLDADYRQIVEGRGGDSKMGSRVSGRVDYRLSPETSRDGSLGTRVDVTLSYALTGTLAQFGRSGLVRDLAVRIGETFAENVDASLRSPTGEPVRSKELGGLSLMMGLMIDRLRTLWSRLLGRKH
jgi:carbon-monoxide dehydrogenase small subunit